MISLSERLEQLKISKDKIKARKLQLDDVAESAAEEDSMGTNEEDEL